MSVGVFSFRSNARVSDESIIRSINEGERIQQKKFFSHTVKLQKTPAICRGFDKVLSALFNVVFVFVTIIQLLVFACDSNRAALYKGVCNNTRFHI